MDFQKEKHEYLSMLVDHGAITQEQSDSLSLLNSNIGLHSNSLTSSLVDCINWGWQSWLKAKATPEGFVLVPKEPTRGMLIAADNCEIDGKVTAHNIYKAMIEAQESANDS
ncbi:hypothetical protein VXP99_09135 [Acinetobacter towneri]|uniref:hypothetical protein n=1 Tax=Acinetobacter towneri TaxID=202956 RepID=UPI003A869A24